MIEIRRDANGLGKAFAFCRTCGRYAIGIEHVYMCRRCGASITREELLRDAQLSNA